MRGGALQVVVLLACTKGILSRAVDIIAEPHKADTDHSISSSAHAAGGLTSRPSGKDASLDDYALYTSGYDEGGESYLNPQTGFLDDVYGDYFFEDRTERSSCKLDANGKPVLDGAYAKMCDIRLEGADAHVRGMAGGLDGVYKVSTCEGGRPAFLRQHSPSGEERLLWFSTVHKDWDFSNGSTANPRDILLYGGENADHLRPEFVGKDEWFIAAEFQADDAGQAEYVKVDVEVHCTKANRAMKKPDPVEAVMQEKPYLTQEEMKQQWRSAITPVVRERLQGEADEPLLSKGMILMLCVAGLVCLGAVPRCLTAREKRRRHGQGPSWIGLTPLGSSKQANA